MATSKNYGEKKGSDHFRDILNPYGEKSNYGKIGRRRRLSKLNVLFFSIILSVTITLSITGKGLNCIPRSSAVHFANCHCSRSIQRLQRSVIDATWRKLDVHRWSNSLQLKIAMETIGKKQYVVVWVFHGYVKSPEGMCLWIQQATQAIQ